MMQNLWQKKIAIFAVVDLSAFKVDQTYREMKSNEMSTRIDAVFLKVWHHH